MCRSETRSHATGGQERSGSMKLIPFDTKPSAEHATDLQALFNWAEEVLRGQFEKLQRATSREELEAIKFDADDLTVIMAIHDALHSGKKKTARSTSRI